MSDLRSALEALDPKNDAHWTGDGLPLMEAVGPGYTRKQVTTAFPHFTRENPSLEGPPKAVEEPEPKDDGVKQSVFGMESSEFGGVSDDDEEDTPYPPPPSPDEVAAVAAKAAEAAAVIAAKKARAEEARAELDQATREQDALVLRKAAMTPPAHVGQQSYLMHYLKNTQKQRPEKSQIDKVMERKDGYGRKRPVFFPQPDKK